jgi:hypothetical protein
MNIETAFATARSGSTGVDIVKRVKPRDPCPVIRALIHHESIGNIRAWNRDPLGRFFIVPNGAGQTEPLTLEQADLFCRGLASAAQSSSLEQRRTQ